MWVELGETRLAASQAKPAIKDFQKALTLDPGRVRAMRGLARSLESSGDPNRALLEWRRVATGSQGAEKAEAETHINALLKQVGLGVSEAEAPTSTAPGAPTTAEAPVKEGHNTAKAPDADKDQLFKSGVDAYRAGKKDAALETFRKVLQKHPGHAGAYYYAGLIRFEKNDADKAKFNLSRATGPYYRPRALYWLSRIDEKAGRKAQAQAGFRKALEMGLEPDLAADAKKRLSGLHAAAPAHLTNGKSHPAVAEPTEREARPAAYPDTLRHFSSWNPPAVPFPALEAKDPAARTFADAAEKRKAKRYDDALEVMRQVQVRYPNTPASQAALLGTGVIQYDMGLFDNVIASCDAFLKEGSRSDLAAQGKFLKALSQLRSGHPKESQENFALPSHKGFPPEAVRQSALAQAQSLSGKRAEAASTLRTAFGQETDPVQRRSLALRAYREYQAVHAGPQALPIVQEALKGCDKSSACLRLSVAKADLSYQSSAYKNALDEYTHIAAAWPESLDAPWARYQAGNCHLRQGHSNLAAQAWKDAARSTSYWGQQAKFRLEELAWRNQAGNRP